VLESEVGEHHGLIDVDGDLLGAALGGDMLSVGQLDAPVVAGKADQVLGYQWHGAPRAFLPRRVRRGLDDDLTDHSPARVVGIAACDEKPRERLCHPQRPWLGRVTVEMS